MAYVNERNFDAMITPAMRQEFWGRVKRSLHEIYGASPDLVDGYRDDVESSPPLGQMLAFHDEPVQIAADLAGRSVSPDDIKKYQSLFPDPIASEQPVATLP
jgi:hypothetical protein